MNENLTNFQWDEEDSLFTDMNPTPKEDLIEKKQAKKESTEDDDFEDPPKKVEEKKVEVELEDDISFENEEENPKVEVDDFFKNLALDLKDKGVFKSVNLEDKFKELEEVNEDSFFEIQNEEIELRATEIVESFFEELDEDAVAFLKFKQKGGNTKDFLNLYSVKSQFDIEELDSKEDVEYTLHYYYKNIEGLDDEDIKDKIEWLKETGKEVKYAEKYFNKIKEDITKKEESLKNEQDKKIEKLEKERKEKITKVSSTLSELTEYKGVTFTDTDKKSLVNFIYKPTVKIDKNNYISEFQNKLNEVFTDENKFLLIAKLLKSDFDFSELIKKGSSKTTKEIKESVSRLKQGSKGITTTDSSKKSLSDFF